MDAQIQVATEAPTVLCVGDDTEMLTRLDRLFGEEDFRFLALSDPMEAIRLFRRYEIQLVISVQRMPGSGENLFLKRIATEFPDTLRAVLIGYAEADLAGRLVQQGRIDKFFLRPWYDEKFKWEIRHALEYHSLIRKNKQLRKSVRDQEAVIRQLGNRFIDSVHSGTHTGDAVLARTVLDQLPLPVIVFGGGNDGIHKIILTNRAAWHLPVKTEPLEPGRRVCEFFPDAIAGRITVALHTGTTRILNRRPLWDGLYDLSCIPLEAGNEHNGGTGMLLLYRIK